MKRTPSRWSSSCWKARAVNPVDLMRTCLPCRLSPFTTTASWRSTSPTQPGLLKQPSYPTWLPSALTIAGLTRPQIWFSSPFTTQTRSGTPIWFAARPAPGASSMVSVRSSSSLWIDTSTRATFFAFSRRTGCSNVRIGRTTSSILPVDRSISIALRHRVHVVAPALAPRRQVARPLQPASLQRDLPAIFATQPMDECRRRAHHADAFDPLLQESSGQRFRRLARRCGCLVIVRVGPGQDRQLGEWRERERFARGQLRGVETVVVPDRRAAQAVMLRVARLDDHSRLPAVAPRAPRHLHHEREGVFRRAVVRKMQRQVRVDHANARDRRQVQPPRHQLRANKDVRTPFAERFPDFEVRVRSFRRVAVEPQHTRSRPQLLDHRLQSLRP